MFCPHCGASVKDGDAFCSSCGKALNSVSGGNAPASGAASAGNASPKKSIGDIPTIWVVVAIVAIAAALYFLWPGGDDASDADSAASRRRRQCSSLRHQASPQPPRRSRKAR